jgi:hypothetical protein
MRNVEHRRGGISREDEWDREDGGMKAMVKTRGTEHRTTQ